jgi:hypothetical protein
VDPRNPQSWNRYAYVLNNPLALVDPLGLVVTCGYVFQNVYDPDEQAWHQYDVYLCQNDNPGGGGPAHAGPGGSAPQKIASSACEAAVTALGAAGGAVVVGTVAGTVGAVVGGAGGTLVAPGIGTVGGSIVGAETLAPEGAGLGALVGGLIGNMVSKAVCSSGSGSGSDQSDCDAQYEADIEVCKSAKSRACYAQAMVRYVQCSKGLSVPPLNF